MLSIGEFARHVGVSVRMLRHYDDLGLLAPAEVDGATGYRSYRAAQFARANRLIALKDLGFTLEQVGRILDGGIGPDELRGMLRLRQAELAEQIDADRQRLDGVAARLRAIEREGRMSEHEFVEKALPAQRIAQVGETVESVGEIGPMVGTLFARLGAQLEAAGVSPTGPATASYAVGPGLAGVGISVGWPVAGGDLPTVDLPAVERALTVVHQGAMTEVGATWQALESEIERRGLQSGGPGREVYLEVDESNPDAWVTELQQPLA